MASRMHRGYFQATVSIESMKESEVDASIVSSPASISLMASAGKKGGKETAIGRDSILFLGKVFIHMRSLIYALNRTCYR